jgi:predicted nucleotide-binding protein (sugar kinase/HSP70/actin superfamily)
MEIHLDKARKLIDQLEKTLNETASQTNSARELLGQWLTKGEATLRNKSAAALKQVRKRADRFTEALTELEKNISKSLDKLTVQVAGKPNPAPKKLATKKPAKKATKKAAKPAPKTAAKKAPTKKK